MASPPRPSRSRSPPSAAAFQCHNTGPRHLRRDSGPREAEGYTSPTRPDLPQFASAPGIGPAEAADDGRPAKGHRTAVGPESRCLVLAEEWRRIALEVPVSSHSVRAVNDITSFVGLCTCTERQRPLIRVRDETRPRCFSCCKFIRSRGDLPAPWWPRSGTGPHGDVGAA